MNFWQFLQMDIGRGMLLHGLEVLDGEVLDERELCLRLPLQSVHVRSESVTWI